MSIAASNAERADRADQSPMALRLVALLLTCIAAVWLVLPLIDAMATYIWPIARWFSATHILGLLTTWAAVTVSWDAAGVKPGRATEVVVNPTFRGALAAAGAWQIYLVIEQAYFAVQSYLHPPYSSQVTDGLFSLSVLSAWGVAFLLASAADLAFLWMYASWRTSNLPAAGDGAPPLSVKAVRFCGWVSAILVACCIYQIMMTRTFMAALPQMYATAAKLDTGSISTFVPGRHLSSIGMSVRYGIETVDVWTSTTWCVAIALLSIWLYLRVRRDIQRD